MAFLFVYGTLRRPFNLPIRRVWVQDAVYVGMGKIRGRLYDLGRYPGAVRSVHEKDFVVGEVYRLPSPKKAFATLDTYEGRQFQRRRSVVRLLNGKKIISWVYLFAGEIAARGLIASGDYVRYRKRR